jgi:hypothetical protein
MGRPLNLHKFGGAVSKAGQQLAVKANLTGTVVTAGLVQQKKQRSFVVVNAGGDKATCTFVDSATPAVGEMSLKITPAVGPAFFAAKITNRYVWDFANNKYSWLFNASGTKVVAEAA